MCISKQNAFCQCKMRKYMHVLGHLLNRNILATEGLTEITEIVFESSFSELKRPFPVGIWGIPWRGFILFFSIEKLIIEGIFIFEYNFCY